MCLRNILIAFIGDIEASCESPCLAASCLFLAAVGFELDIMLSTWNQSTKQLACSCSAKSRKTH
jgi:hypothetical protein